MKSKNSLTLKRTATKVLSDQNDLEQYDPRWNLRQFNVQETIGDETPDDCARTCLPGIY